MKNVQRAKICALAFLSLGLMSGIQARTEPHKPAKKPVPLAVIYFMPFTTQTYSAISSDGFEGINRQVPPRYLLDLDTLKSIDEYIGHMGDKAEFNDSLVRLRVDLPKGRVILVDQYGTVKRDGKEFSMRPYDFLRLDQLLETRSKD